MKYILLSLTFFACYMLSAQELPFSTKERIEEIEKLLGEHDDSDDSVKALLEKTETVIGSLSQEEYSDNLELFYYRANGNLQHFFRIQEDGSLDEMKRYLTAAADDLHFIIDNVDEESRMGQAAILNLQLVEGVRDNLSSDKMDAFFIDFKNEFLYPFASNRKLRGDALTEDVYKNLMNNPELKEMFFEMLQCILSDPLVELGKAKNLHVTQFRLGKEDEEDELSLFYEIEYEGLDGAIIRESVYF